MISIWEKESFFAPQDIIVVGSGFVGLWSAFYLKKKHPGLKITITERGLIPTGASTRNAGFACFGSLSEVVRDAQVMGTDKMLQLVEMRFKGLERIQKYFPDDAIDFQLCGGYELYDPLAIPEGGQLEENITYINALLKDITGSKHTYRQVDDLIPAFGFSNTTHLVKNRLEGMLHSGKLAQALLQKVQGMGVQVLNGIEVKSIHKYNGMIKLETGHPFSLSGRRVLLCTNAFTKDLVPGIDIQPARGQVVLTSPIKGLAFKGTFHSDEGYYYFRNLGNRVLLGGARNKAFRDEETTDMNPSDVIQSHLERYLDEVVLPGQKGSYTVEHRWAGIMAMGSEKIPIVEKLDEGVYCAVRMSGMGVALAPVVAQQVSKLLQD